MRIEEVLSRGVDQILPSKKALAALMRKKKLTLYQGFDPSSPDLQIGNLVGIRKLAQFQKLGHKVIFLIGDFTGMIGDPTDKAAVRKKSSHEQVLKNAQTYKEQVKNILKFVGPNAAEIRYNYQWLSKLNFKEIIELTSYFTIQQIIERDFYQERLKRKKPIYLHEFLYPLMQGYDSVFMNVDLEVGGSDQLFNMMPGRALMKNLKNKEKYILTMKLLTDSTGKKMGKTEGNTVNLTDKPENIFGKIMSWPDSLLVPAGELLTDLPLNFCKGKKPMEAKKQLALEVVSQIHGAASAQKAKAFFEKTFQKRNLPKDISVIKVDFQTSSLLNLVTASQLVSSKSEVKRLIRSGALDIDGKTLNDPNAQIAVPKKGVILRIGKSKFVKIVCR